MNTPRFAAAGLVAICAFALSLTIPVTASHDGWQIVRPSLPFQGVMPPPRDYGASIVDAGGNLLMFGGRTNAGASFNDVWVLTNGTGPFGTTYWNERVPFGTPPSPRYNAGIALDAANNRVIVFGGCEGACLPALNDVWVLYNAFGDNNSPPAVWKQLVTTGIPPAPRHAMLAAYSGFNELIIYGGHDGSGTVYTDVWTLDNANGFPGPSEWHIRTTTGSPHPGGYAPTGVYDPGTDQLIVTGGYNASQQPTNAVDVLNFVRASGNAAWTNTVPEGAAGSPPPFAFSGGAFDWVHRRLLFTVPNHATDSHDIWTLQNATTWTQFSPPFGPSPSISTVQGVGVSVVGVVTAYFAGPIPFSPTFAASLDRHPVFTGMTPAEGATFTVRQGQQFTATIEAQDPDEWDLVFIDPVAGLPVDATLSPSSGANPISRVLNWDTSNFAGTVQFTFQATDNDFGFLNATRSFTVVVTPDSSPRFVSPPTPASQIVVTTGMPVAFTVEAADPDPGDFAFLTLDGTSLPPSAVFTGGGLTPYQVNWTPSPTQAGFYGALFKIIDEAEMSLFWPVSVVVLPNNPPEFFGGSGISATTGQPLQFFISAQDNDPFQHRTTITVDASTLPPGATGGTAATLENWTSFQFNWTPGPGSSGDHIVRFIASDQYGASRDLYFVIRVADPQLVSISVNPSPVTKHVGAGQQFQATGTFSDGSTKLLPSGPPTPGLGGSPLWQTLFSPAIDVSACATAQYPSIGAFSSQVLTDRGGFVDETWPPMTPVLRINGSIHAGAISLNLSCTDNSSFGSLNAMWTGTRYEGTFTFGASSGQVSILGWSTQFSLLDPRLSFGAASYLDRIYAIGGKSGSNVLATNQLFYPVGGGWVTGPPMPTAREGLAVAASGDLIFAIGGNVTGGAPTGVVEAFDHTTNQWSSNYTPMPTPRAHMMMAEHNGRLYVFGGDTGAGITNVVESFDPATNTWTTLTPMPTGRSAGVAASFGDGRIAVLGGLTASGQTAVNELFDVATNTWSPGTAMPSARVAFGGGVANGGFYVFGGTTNGAPNASTFVYVPATPTTSDGWAMLGSMPSPRWGLASAVVGDVVYGIGGEVDYQQPGTVAITTTALSTPPASVYQLGASSSSPLPTVQWTSTNQSVAMIDVSGNASTLTTGQTTIVATAAGISCQAGGTCATLNVTNSAPSAQIVGGPFTFTEGNPPLQLSSNINDPDGDPVSVVWSIVSGPGQLNSPNNFSTGFFNGDGPSDTVVRLTASDNHGLSTVTETTIHTINRNPQVSIFGSGSVMEGGTFSTGGSFNDAVADTWTATVNYGDGTGDQPLPFTGTGETKNFSLSHVYAHHGSYVVLVTVTDDDGGAGQAQTQVVVTAPPQSSPDSLMHGAGYIDEGGRKQHFTFRASQSGNVDAAQLEYWITQRGGGNRFRATVINSVTFAAGMDNVTIVGTGTWNNVTGYTFEARATDRGEPGRNDQFAIVVKDAGGAVIASVNGTLDGGNIQSTP